MQGIIEIQQPGNFLIVTVEIGTLVRKDSLCSRFHYNVVGRPDLADVLNARIVSAVARRCYFCLPILEAAQAVRCKQNI